ncbi:thiamine phosphate synthase [bacterium]|nr:thiamine phosphate synthase [bacterium]
MFSPIDFRLYLITDRRNCLQRELGDVVDRACQAGVKAVQLREKDLSAREFLSLAKQIQNRCRSHNADLFVNDRCDIAKSISAVGVHLTSQSLPADLVRARFPSLRCIGVSTHSVDEARDAEERGCDFILFGPVFETPAKMAYSPPQGLKALHEVTRSVSIPVLAVGGINPVRAEACLESGAEGVAVISAIMQAKDLGRVVSEFKTKLGSL